MSLVNGLGVWGWVLVAVWVAAALVSLSPLSDRTRGIVVTLLGGAAPVLMLWSAGAAAAAHVAATSDIARTSLLWAAWLSLFASYVVIFAATAWLQPGALRGVLTYLPVVGVVVLMVTGQLSELAVAREYANNAEIFAVELRLHLAYVAGAVSIGLVSGLVLGLLAVRRRSLEPAIFGTLNVLQVFPTLAFIGLMNPILSGAVRPHPTARRARRARRGLGAGHHRAVRIRRVPDRAQHLHVAREPRPRRARRGSRRRHGPHADARRDRVPARAAHHRRRPARRARPDHRRRDRGRASSAVAGLARSSSSAPARPRPT